jgi:hypothetical protein
MVRGTIVFVHGTGVRLKDYGRGIEIAQKAAAAADITESFVECAWGDPLGIVFEGQSLPDPPSPQKLEKEQEDFARWSWLFDDPLFELDKLTIRDTSAVAKTKPMPGAKPEWKVLWERISAYQPSLELQLLLERGGLAVFWAESWERINRVSSVARDAFEASAHELPEASHALARALVAQLHVVAVEAGAPGPSRALRDSIVERLIRDWEQHVYGLGTFFAKMFKRAATSVLRNHRDGFSDAAALPVGDILLYQSRGAQVREFIRRKIEEARPPVTLVAHSLGGIACVDLLALSNPPTVARLVTAGSQSPFLYEIDALLSLKRPQALPGGFPPWLNLYDRNDFLSYVAHRLWPAVVDMEIESGQPFPDSHGAYFGNAAVWKAIREFIDR